MLLSAGKSFSQDTVVCRVVKIDSIGNYNIIYAKDFDDVKYKIVSAKSKIDCKNIQVNNEYEFVLFGSNKYFNIVSSLDTYSVYPDGTRFLIENNWGGDLYSAQNLRGLCYKDKNIQMDTLNVVYLNKSNNKLLHIFKPRDRRDVIYLAKLDEIISEIVIPYKCSFSTLINENKSGFEISVEYYISECYYNKVFNFKYQDSNYFLTRIYTSKFDNSNPKKIKKTKDKLKSKVPIDKFKIDDYL